MKKHWYKKNKKHTLKTYRVIFLFNLYASNALCHKATARNQFQSQKR